MGIDLCHGDCLEVMGRIPDGSIDLILTSPPYDNLRQYANGSVFDFEAIAAQCKRVLKPGGVLVWVVGDQTINGSETGTSFRQALHFKEIGLRLRDTMIWQKKNPFMGGDRSHYVGAFEFMFVLTNGRPSTINVLRESCLGAGKLTASFNRQHGKEISRGQPKVIQETKPKSNIWSYATTGGISSGHPAVFPLQLAIDHILSWTNPGDTVLDPFAGSGTTLEACTQTWRNGIGIDVSVEYLEIAEKRVINELNKTPLFPDEESWPTRSKTQTSFVW